MASIEEPLDLHPSSADPVRFVPMDLGPSDCTIPEPDHRRALELDPPAVTVLLDEAVKLPDLGPSRDGFSFLDPSNKLEVHGRSSLYRKPGAGKEEIEPRPDRARRQGSVLSESTGLWFQGTNVLIYECPSGRQLLTPAEKVDRAESELARLRDELECMRALQS